MTRSSKLRIGYFAQHQVDELHIDETPLQHIMRLRPAEGQAGCARGLAGFGLMADQADTVVGRLSGGQKARLSLAFAGDDRRAASVDPRRTDQPPRHRKP